MLGDTDSLQIGDNYSRGYYIIFQLSVVKNIEMMIAGSTDFVFHDSWSSMLSWHGSRIAMDMAKSSAAYHGMRLFAHTYHVTYMISRNMKCIVMNNTAEKDWNVWSE